jgi:hypothetical protein
MQMLWEDESVQFPLLFRTKRITVHEKQQLKVELNINAALGMLLTSEGDK